MECPECQGKGFTEYEAGLIQIACPVCLGTGEVDRPTVGDIFQSGQSTGDIGDITDVPGTAVGTTGVPTIDTRVKDDSINRTGPDNQSIGSGDTGKPAKPQKSKTKKTARKKSS